MALRAIIFDCDGVIVDSESHHFEAFRVTLEGEGIGLTRAEYDRTYLAMDDKGCFTAALRAAGRPVDTPILKRLILNKKARYAALADGGLVIYPGVAAFVDRARGKYRLAVASGAFRAEIKAALDCAGIRSAFEVIVSAQDVKRGKPDPEAYQTALAQLNARSASQPPISPAECVVIEDSIHGLQSARAAGMHCLAVTHSYPRAFLLPLADRVIDDLTEIEPADLEWLTAPRTPIT